MSLNDSAGRDVMSPALIAIVLSWVVVVALGTVWIWDYKTTPGVASGPPASWPDSVNLPRSRTTLVVALHPLCTCSQATISELARVMAAVSERPTVYALFYDYRPGGKALTETSLWQRASGIPGVVALVDRNGELARSFGAQTSGDVIAYAPDGKLAFHGGLTSARGHEGDSFGRRRLLAVLKGEAPDRSESPVFGCELGELASQSL